MRKMVQVVDDEVVKDALPKVGTLEDGSTVSGYHLQMKKYY